MQVSHDALLRQTAAAAQPCRRQPSLHLRHPRRSSSLRLGCTMRSPNLTAPDKVPFQQEKAKHEILIKDNKPRDLPEMVDSIRAALKSVGDGGINVSAYDTAWVALVKNIDGGDGPQFPSSIDWIVRNQQADGSWGDKEVFMAQDRIINTLACTIALKSWNIHHDKCRKGISFINENLWRLTEEDDDRMLIGFEIAFPALLEMAKNLRLNLPFDEPALQTIYAAREKKLAKIPRDLLHTIPTSLLFSIEGMQNLDWDRLLKLRHPNGSFFTGLASTAYALMQTGDKKCFQYIDAIVRKYNGGVPLVYPVDLFERLWSIDRLERLGISRYFTSEFAEFLDYVHRYWTEGGVSFARDATPKDVDDTSMCFRILRLHGYPVSASVFKTFEKDGGEFVCYPGQTNQSVTAIYNMHRAAQVAFPGEDELRRANSYASAFLEARRASGTVIDKWVISKDLHGEVEYALDFPWRTSLPRIQARMYLEQYGGSSDVWIGKVLYRMPLVNNDLYLEAAKADFSDFQRRCRLEWHGLKKWCDKNDLGVFGVTPERALRAYFLAAANIFEPEREAERLAWARTSVVAEAVSWHLQCNGSNKERLIRELENDHGNNELTREQDDQAEKSLLCALREVTNLVVDDSASDDFREAWKQWLRSWTAKEGHESCGESTALLLVSAIEICSGRHRLNEKNLNLTEYSHLERLTSSICSKLASRVNDKSGVNIENTENSDYEEMDLEMQELTQRVLQRCNSVNKVTRQTFLYVTKSFYYVAHCSPEMIDTHISKVIFEDVV